MDEEFLPKIWGNRPGSLFRAPALLVMDTAPRHMVDEVKKTCQKMNTTIKYVPGGMTPLLQPADTHLNRTIKSFMTEKWNSWMFQEDRV